MHRRDVLYRRTLDRRTAEVGWDVRVKSYFGGDVVERGTRSGHEVRIEVFDAEFSRTGCKVKVTRHIRSLGCKSCSVDNVAEPSPSREVGDTMTAQIYGALVIPNTNLKHPHRMVGIQLIANEIGDGHKCGIACSTTVIDNDLAVGQQDHLGHNSRLQQPLKLPSTLDTLGLQDDAGALVSGGILGTEVGGLGEGAGIGSSARV